MSRTSHEARRSGSDVHVRRSRSSFLGGAQRPRRPDARVSISVRPGTRRTLGWPADAELVCDERQPDGAVNFRIEAHPERAT